MATEMSMGHRDGWTWLGILNTYVKSQGYDGVFVCLLQRDEKEDSLSCSQCASTEQVHLLCETILPLQPRVGLVWPLGTWKPLCSTCSIGLIDDWRTAGRGQSHR